MLKSLTFIDGWSNLFGNIFLQNSTHLAAVEFDFPGYNRSEGVELKCIVKNNIYLAITTVAVKLQSLVPTLRGLLKQSELKMLEQQDAISCVKILQLINAFCFPK